MACHIRRDSLPVLNTNSDCTTEYQLTCICKHKNTPFISDLENLHALVSPLPSQLRWEWAPLHLPSPPASFLRPSSPTEAPRGWLQDVAGGPRVSHPIRRWSRYVCSRAAAWAKSHEQRHITHPHAPSPPCPSHIKCMHIFSNSLSALTISPPASSPSLWWGWWGFCYGCRSRNMDDGKRMHRGFYNARACLNAGSKTSKHISTKASSVDPRRPTCFCRYACFSLREIQRTSAESPSNLL